MKDRKTPGTQRSPQTFRGVYTEWNEGAQGDKAHQPRASLSRRLLEQQVALMQKQIAQASQHDDIQAVHTLQQRLMESEAARLMAVRRVTEENAGKDTAGVDGVKSLTSKERLVMASTIHPQHWNNQPPRPVRRVWIPKPGTTERRPLAILTMMDRCKQALVKLALEPEWEVRFEPHSYGYRHDDLMEQQLLNWASRRHPGKARDWLLARYWRRFGQQRRVFATDDGIVLRSYQQRGILGG